MALTKICKASEIQEGELYRFESGDKSLLVTRRNDRFIVASAICTHEEADLTLGIFLGDTVTCPLHQAKFDLRNGGVISGPDGDSPDTIPELKVYEVRVEKDDLLADI